MNRRALTGALLAGTLLGPAHAGRADILYETSAPVVAGSVLLPTSSYVSTASTYVPTAYSSSLLPTSAVVGTVLDDYAYIPTSTVRYRSSVLRPRRFVERTSYYYAPTSYLAPTSYVTPTSYYLPTSTYVPTSYYVPTSTYVPTSVTRYVRPTRYYVPTASVASLLPTTAYVDPTVVTTSYDASPCEETAAPAPAPAARVAPPVRTNPPAPTNPPAATQAERPPTGVIQSSPAEPGIAEPSMSTGDVNSTTRATKPAPAPAPAPVQNPAAVDSGAETQTPPPASTLPEVPIPPPGGSGSPKSSAYDPGVPTTRDASKAIYSTPMRALPRDPVLSRNVLRGRVVSYDGGTPEEGVTVYLTSSTGAFSDRTTLTNADGQFAITLPDGDWSVKVRMRSGNVRNVTSEAVTATSGKIVDAAGRGVSEFVITR